MLQSILMLFLQTSPFFLGLAALTAFGHRKPARILTNGVHNDLERKPIDGLDYMVVGRGCRYREGLVTMAPCARNRSPFTRTEGEEGAASGHLTVKYKPCSFLVILSD